jgi:hypothetical protein
VGRVEGATWIPSLVSEREPDGTWEDCTWAGGVMLANAGTGADWYARSRAEYEALRVAGGDGPAENPGDGSNLGQLAAGMAARYGWAPGRIDGWPAVALRGPGTAVAVTGRYAILPTHYRRHDPGFFGAHLAVAVKTHVGWWWLDPLAPAGYPGEPISSTDLGRFVATIGGALYVGIGRHPRMDIEAKIERWALDGGPGKVTTLGAPRIAGAVDWRYRLAYVTGQAGVNPRLELLARARLSDPTAVLDVDLRAALAAYRLTDPILADKLARIAAVLAE